MKKRLPALLLMFAMLIAPAAAVNAYRQQITVEYGINLNFNGQPAKLIDGAGKEVQSFVYNGSTYVPIRAVADYFGADVSYDSANNAAIIYDDRVEIMSATYMLVDTVHKMDKALYSMLSDAKNVFDGTSSAAIQLVTFDIQDNRAMTAALSTENTQYSVLTTNHGLGKSIIERYQSCLTAYQTATSKFTMLSSQYANISHFSEMEEAHQQFLAESFFMYLDAEKLMKDMNWRDVTDF